MIISLEVGATACWRNSNTQTGIVNNCAGERQQRAARPPRWDKRSYVSKYVTSAWCASLSWKWMNEFWFDDGMWGIKKTLILTNLKGISLSTVAAKPFFFCAHCELQIHKTWKPRLLDSQRLFTKSHGNSMERKDLTENVIPGCQQGEQPDFTQNQPQNAACHIWLTGSSMPADTCKAWCVIRSFLCSGHFKPGVIFSVLSHTHTHRLKRMARRKRRNLLNCYAWTQAGLHRTICDTTGTNARKKKKKTALGATWKARPRTLQGLRNI